jgi:hypothetical protein
MLGPGKPAAATNQMIEPYRLNLHVPPRFGAEVRP